MTDITVSAPGVLSFFQDNGRQGRANIGLTEGGASDKYAYYWANKLVGNSDNTPAIEIVVGGFSATCHCKTTIAFTGAQCELLINGQAVSMWQSHPINPGDKIDLKFAQAGCRIYFAVAGGFNCESFFDSASTVTREQLGSALDPRQKLTLLANKHTPRLKVKTDLQSQFNQHICLRFVPGYQYEDFGLSAQKTLEHNTYTVTNQCDRMGYRLSGPAITHNINQMVSEGICLGAIQVPADGQPIVLLRDRQTIGGYPKMGAVLSIDINNLMQATEGTTVSFEPISALCAHNLLHLQQHTLKRSDALEAVK